MLGRYLVRPKDQTDSENRYIQRDHYFSGSYLFDIKVTLGLSFTQIIKLYDRISPESGDADHVPADLAHHFLLAICTRPGTGICFKDRGWYPRESDFGDHRNANQDDDGPVRGKIHNKILANVLKTLKVNEDSRQQELALKIMSACPELVAGWI